MSRLLRNLLQWYAFLNLSSNGCGIDSINLKDEPDLNEGIEKTTSNQEEQKRKYAILLIDATYSFLFSQPYSIQIYGGDSVYGELEKMGFVLNQANSKNISIYEITFADCNPLSQQCSPQNTHPALVNYRTNNWKQLKKKYGDAFRETTLDEMLKAEGITDIILMGYNQSFCVRDTAQTAYNLGYSLHTSWDIIQGHNGKKCVAIEEDEPPYNVKEIMCYFKQSDLVPITSTEFESKEDVVFYREHTHLVPTYIDLPIFKKSVLPFR